jgi:hypothetical protein
MDKIVSMFVFMPKGLLDPSLWSSLNEQL